MNDGKTERPGYEEEERPETVGGAVGGAALGAVGGGFALGVLGPIGGVLGALASYAGGWWAGRELIQAVRELDDVEGQLREAHPEVGPGRSWDEIRHACQVGYLAGRNPRWGEEPFEAVEGQLRSAWHEAHRGAEDPIPWEEIRSHAERGWEVGRRHG